MLVEKILFFGFLGLYRVIYNTKSHGNGTCTVFILKRRFICIYLSIYIRICIHEFACVWHVYVIVVVAPLFSWYVYILLHPFQSAFVSW